MIAQPISPQPHRAHSHPHAQLPISLTVTTATIPITHTVLPAHAGIQRLGSCGVRS
jgi:hypothetical protein